MFDRLLAGASVATRALLLIVLAQATAIFVHEAIHLQQAWVGGETELSMTFNPTRESCDGAFACATASHEYEPGSFWQGEGWPRFVERVIFFEIVVGLGSWVYDPWRNRNLARVKAMLETIGA
jgi:hypothetical protein